MKSLTFGFLLASVSVGHLSAENVCSYRFISLDTAIDRATWTQPVTLSGGTEVSISDTQSRTLNLNRGDQSISEVFVDYEGNQIELIAALGTGALAVVKFPETFILTITKTTPLEVERMQLPNVYPDRDDCGWFVRLLGFCFAFPASYSPGLKALFSDGLDRLGVFRSTVHGLPTGPLDLSAEGLVYLGDTAQGLAVLRAPDRSKVLFDGKDFWSCASQ